MRFARWAARYIGREENLGRKAGRKTMKRRVAAVWMMAIGAVALVAGCGRELALVEDAAPPSDYVSPECLAASPDGKTVYVTCATAQRVMAVALDGSPVCSWNLTTTKTAVPVPVNPTGVAVAPDGGVWVTCGVQGGELQSFAPDGTRREAVAVGHWPCAPVVSRDGHTIYLLNRFAARIVAVDAKRMTVVNTWRALREPFAAALGAGDRFLFVANMLPSCAATNEQVSAAVTVLDLRSGETRHFPLPNGSTGMRGIAPDAVSPPMPEFMNRMSASGKRVR